jgi:hypothetical protein
VKFSFRSITGLALLVVLLLPNQAQAHRFAPSLLKIVEFNKHNYNVAWKTPTEATSNIPLRPAWPVSCEIKSERPAVREGTGTVYNWTLVCDQPGSNGLVGQRIRVTGLAENRASAMVTLSLVDGRDYQRVLSAKNQHFLVPESPSQNKVITAYSVLGIEHIWSGLDHLMFVFGLLLLVGVGSSLLWTITSFTVGHSITLALVTLGILDYPVLIIEFAIALSIFLLALELASKKSIGQNKSIGRLVRLHPWWLAGGFGLLHGMGFAGALVEIGLPQNNLPLALLFFNIGIEVGQIAFVLLGMGFWWLFKSTLISKQVTINQELLLPVPVYVLGGLSAMWCIERGLNILG